MRSKNISPLITSGLPFVAFLVIGWYGLASVVQSKRELRNASKGVDSLEEMDPVERMRQRYGIRDGSGNYTSVPKRPPPKIKSLEEELQDTLSKVDIKDFDYKPVPRLEEEE